MSLTGHTVPAPSPLPEGTILKNYRLLQVLGQGGFGITYFASEIETNRNIIIKECFPVGMCVRDAVTVHIRPMYPELLDDYEASIESLKEEVDKLAKLDYRHIEHIEEVFESHGSIFYVTPWLIGGSLLSRITDAEAGLSPLAPDLITIWLKQILSGLDVLHSMGIYHGKIKPSHVLFDESEHPTLIGFDSTAHVSDVMDSTEQDIAPSSYAAPEQITDKGDIGPWTDFYALSALWYRLISSTPVANAQNRLNGEQTPLLSSYPQASQYPPNIIDAIDQNLSLDYNERFQSTSDWKNILNPQATRERKPKAVINKNKQRLLISMAIAALLLIGLMGVIHRAEQSPPSKVVTMGALEPEPKKNQEDSATPPVEETPATANPSVIIDSPTLQELSESITQLHHDWVVFIVKYEQMLLEQETYYKANVSTHQPAAISTNQYEFPRLSNLYIAAQNEWFIYSKKAEKINNEWGKEMSRLAQNCPEGDASLISDYFKALEQKNKVWLDNETNAGYFNNPIPTRVETLYERSRKRLVEFYQNFKQLQQNSLQPKAAKHNNRTNSGQSKSAAQNNNTRRINRGQDRTPRMHRRFN